MVRSDSHVFNLQDAWHACCWSSSGFSCAVLSIKTPRVLCFPDHYQFVSRIHIRLAFCQRVQTHHGNRPPALALSTDSYIVFCRASRQCQPSGHQILVRRSRATRDCYGSGISSSGSTCPGDSPTHSSHPQPQCDRMLATTTPHTPPLIQHCSVRAPPQQLSLSSEGCWIPRCFSPKPM